MQIFFIIGKVKYPFLRARSVAYTYMNICIHSYTRNTFIIHTPTQSHTNVHARPHARIHTRIYKTKITYIIIFRIY